MFTWIAVGIVFAIGGFAHYAGLEGKSVLVVCTMVVALGLVADWLIADQPSRFDY
jgi:hypothetical protein